MEEGSIVSITTNSDDTETLYTCCSDLGPPSRTASSIGSDAAEPTNAVTTTTAFIPLVDIRTYRIDRLEHEVYLRVLYDFCQEKLDALMLTSPRRKSM